MESVDISRKDGKHQWAAAPSMVIDRGNVRYSRRQSSGAILVAGTELPKESDQLEHRLTHTFTGYRVVGLVVLGLVVLLVVVALVGAALAQSPGYDVQAFLNAHRQKTNEEVLRRFPFAAYLQRVPFTDFQTLQRDRLLFYRARGIGDPFLYRLADRFVQLYPVRMDHLNEMIAIGEAYVDPNNKRFHPNDQINRHICEIYETIGYFILMRVANRIQAEIARRRWNPNEPSNRLILDRLARSRVYVSFEESTLDKLKENVQQGNWAYLWKRMWGKVQELFGTGDDVRPASAATRQLRGKALKLKEHRRFYPLRDGSFGLHLFRLRRGPQQIGHVVWMPRPPAKAHYLAYRQDGRNVAQRLAGWRRSATPSMMAVMTGGFTNAYLQPEGLTVEDGTVVNAVIMPDRHGLVIVEQGGGIRVANLKGGRFVLPRSRTSTTRVLQPLASMTDYSELLAWCRRRSATVFQTQLLAFADSLLIDPHKAQPDLRERRLLALVRAADGTLSHVVFDVTQPGTLAGIAEEIFATLKVRKLKVEALLNLDVGSFNILQVFDPHGNVLADVRGPVALDRATNLIVYTR